MPGRTPAMTAMTAATLDNLSDGRMILGLGSSGPQVAEGWHGQRFGPQLKKTREYIAVVRMALARERVAFKGDTLSCRSRTGRASRSSSRSRRCRSASRSTSPRSARRTRRSAAEVADGYIPSLFSPEHVDQIRPLLEEGFARAGDGKGFDDFDIAPSVNVFVSDDLESARDVMRPFLALYVGGMGSRDKNFYNRIVPHYGFEDAAREVQDLYLEGARRRRRRRSRRADRPRHPLRARGPRARAPRRARRRRGRHADRRPDGLDVRGPDAPAAPGRRAGTVSPGPAAALRALRPGDADGMLEVLQACERSWADFAPSGWTPPPAGAAHWVRELEHSGDWTHVAEEEAQDRRLRELGRGARRRLRAADPRRGQPQRAVRASGAPAARHRRGAARRRPRRRCARRATAGGGCSRRRARRPSASTREQGWIADGRLAWHHILGFAVIGYAREL